MQARLTRKVPRALMFCIRSSRLGSVCSVPVRWMAEALLMQMSMPPKRSTVRATAASIWSASRMSHSSGKAWPPAASISAAAVWMVPGSVGCGSEVLAAKATLAPSRAARSAIARPMPREPPLMNRVLPWRDMIFLSGLPRVGALLGDCTETKTVRLDSMSILFWWPVLAHNGQ